MILCSDFVLVLEYDSVVHVALVECIYDLIGDFDVHMPILPLPESNFRVAQSI